MENAMIAATPFRLNRNRMLLALISAAFAIEASAAAGRVEFAFGGASVTGADGRTRPATRGSELDTGDVVRTTDGRVQIRMTDGAYISLQPNTEWGIKNYRFEGKTDGTESAFYSLVKGAMRTVTGLVGRVNRNRYQVGTPTATVGIRGTGGLIQILPDGSTLVQGTSGIWFLANPSGSIDIPAGVSGLAPADPKQAPQETAAVPFAGPTPPPVEDKAEYVQGDQRTDTGDPVLVATSGQLLQSGSGYLGTVAYSWSGGPQMTFTQGATATFDAAGRLTSISDSFGQILTSNGTSITDFGNDGIVAWGRWTGNVTGKANISGLVDVNENYSANQGLHYVVGMPTAQMPTVGSATYTLLGATSPTYIDGSTAPGTLTGSLNVDFGRLTVGVNLNAAMPDGKGYVVGGTAQISSNFIFGSTGNGLTTSGTGGACSSGCSALVNGFFAGTTAERAGLGYHINDFLANKDVIGAAAFKK
jgi:hypothetical protein